MRTTIVFLLFVVLFLESSHAGAQRYFVLQKKGEVKNFKYQEGNKIHLETSRGNFELKGEILQISDTSILIDNFEVGLSNIAAIYRSSGFLNRLSSLFFIQGGIAYFLIDGTNRAIHKEYPIIDESTLMISGTMIVTGFAIRPFITRKFDLSKNWQVKILNFDAFKIE
ncbi:MAG: hypothetical protein IH598_06585 [Bacteroidales bacterium]|nr:hypothetical protein [Bacteroidales bacterium]